MGFNVSGHASFFRNPVYYFYNDVTDAEFDELLELASMENQSLG